MSPVYDSGVLVAADRSDRAVWADHRARLEMGVIPITTAPVVAQVSRSPLQAQLFRFLRGCEVVPFGAADAHEVGRLLGDAGASDIVDGHVVITAFRRGAPVLTGDVDDLARLAAHFPARVSITRL